MISELVTWYIHRSLRPDPTELSFDSTGDDFLYETAWETATKHSKRNSELSFLNN